MIILIERLWIDPMENHNAYGYSPVGIVTTKDDADRICALNPVKKADYPWPLKNVNPGSETVPRYRQKPLLDLSELTDDEICSLI